MKFEMIGINDDGSHFEEGPIALKASTKIEAEDEAKSQWEKDGGWYKYNVLALNWLWT